MIVLIGLPTVVTWSFTREVQNHIFFRKLTQEQVASFSIGSLEIKDRHGKTLIVHALHQVQWFSSHHGGWAEPVDFRIRLAPGDERYFRLAFYRKEPGVVVEFSPHKGHTGLHVGYAFSRPLLDAMTEMGIALPH